MAGLIKMPLLVCIYRSSYQEAERPLVATRIYFFPLLLSVQAEEEAAVQAVNGNLPAVPCLSWPWKSSLPSLPFTVRRMNAKCCKCQVPSCNEYIMYNYV